MSLDGIPEAPDTAPVTDPIRRVEHDFTRASLDALRRLAEHGRDAATRSAARRALDVRTAGATPTTTAEPTYRVTVERSEYGTPRPAVHVTVPGGRERDARAAAHELAADIERALAPTHEPWTIAVEADELGASAGVCVAIALWDGSAAEVRRAVAVLEGATGSEVRRPGRRGRTRAGAVVGAGGQGAPDSAPTIASTDGPETAMARPADTGPADSAAVVGSAPDEEADSEARSRRRRKQKYREAAGTRADSFEAGTLAGDRSGWPEYVVTAASGGHKSADYWRWLLEQWRAAGETGGAR